MCSRLNAFESRRAVPFRPPPGRRKEVDSYADEEHTNEEQGELLSGVMVELYFR